jgi:hypothetical protein
MATITFDTLKYTKRLRDAGMAEAQAEALAEAQKETLSEVMDTTLATKNDFVELREELLKIHGEIALMKWMLGAVFGGVVAVLLKLFLKA